MNPYSTGADKSPKDLRTFAYVPDPAQMTGGTRYKASDIDDQHKVGICTAIHLTQNAGKALGIEFSPDFQYLLQKKEYDKNWNEGSSIFYALKVAKNFGLLPIEKFKYIKEADRKLPYDLYIKKLQAIPDKEIERLKKSASKNKLLAYASVPIDRDMLANAISESESGILVRFDLGKEWWTKPIEPLRPPKEIVSGHATIICNYDGGSFRIANTWGSDWADKGTAYFLLKNYKPTEAWIPYYTKTSSGVDAQQEKLKSLQGRAITLLQQFVKLLQ